MLKFALVGCGNMANAHARNLQKLSDVQVVALCDSRRESAVSFKDRYFSQATIFQDYEQMLKDLSGELDGVVLVTPHTLHYAQAKAAMESGMNVLVEKPMVTSSTDAYDLWRTSKRTGRQIGIAFQAPCSTEYRYLAAERDAGRLGTIHVISGFTHQGWLQFTNNTWRRNPALSGGGFMYDTGAHLLNAMMWLMDEPVVEVGCFCDNLGTPVDINAALMLRFASGALGSVGMCGDGTVFQNDVVLQGQRVLVRTRPHGGELEVWSNGKRLYPHVPNLPDGQETPAANFVNALLGREPMACGARNGVLLSVLMDAAYEAAASHQLVKVQAVPRDVPQP